MNRISIYHGSPYIIEQPIFGKGKPYNDYGSGFYCTESEEPAKEWACDEGTDGYANLYEIELDDLHILNLSANDYSVLNWLAILLYNRRGRLSSPVERRGAEYLMQHFMPDYTPYDVIIGYRADDSYFSFARSFVGNGISLAQLAYAMKLGKLGEQFVLKSEKAFRTTHFLDYIPADSTIYYAKRKARDESARAAFMRELEKEDMTAIFMRDIIREEMQPHDERLR